MRRLANTDTAYLRFGAVTDVHLSPDGWIYVLELTAGQLRAFGPSEFEWMVGARGQEGVLLSGFWKSAQSFAVSGDTVAVLDHYGSALHFIDRLTGKPIREGRGRGVIPVKRSSPVVDFLRVARTAMGWILVENRQLTDPPGSQRLRTAVFTARPIRLPDAALGEIFWTGEESGLLSAEVAGRMVPIIRPFAPNGAWTVANTGLYSVDSLSRVWRHRPGVAPQELPIRLPQLPVTRQMLDDYYQEERTRPRMDTFRLKEAVRIPPPPYRGTVSRLRVSPDGALALVRADLVATPAVSTDSVFVDLYNADGTSRGIAALPPGFELKQFTGMELVGVETSRTRIFSRSREGGLPIPLKEVVVYRLP